MQQRACGVKAADDQERSAIYFLPGSAKLLLRSTSNQRPRSPGRWVAAQSLLLGCPQIYSHLPRPQQLMTHHPAGNMQAAQVQSLPQPQFMLALSDLKTGSKAADLT